jgi:RNA polymerase sigma-70 factor (ECF subfamily)
MVTHLVGETVAATICVAAVRTLAARRKFFLSGPNQIFFLASMGLVVCKESISIPAMQSPSLIDESSLIRAAQQGDQEAFTSLVRLYDQNVLRIAMNLLRSPDVARDVYQEAFLRVYRNLHSFRFDCRFETWLYRIVTNICLDHLRKRKVRKEESAVVETRGGELNLLESVEENRADNDPQRRLLAGELRQRIDRALADLTPRERMVFELRHYQGLRLRAIGESLGTTEEAAKNCLFRATQKMRAALGDYA